MLQLELVKLSVTVFTYEEAQLGSDDMVTDGTTELTRVEYKCCFIFLQKVNHPEE